MAQVPFQSADDPPVRIMEPRRPAETGLRYYGVLLLWCLACSQAMAVIGHFLYLAESRALAALWR